MSVAGKIGFGHSTNGFSQVGRQDSIARSRELFASNSWQTRSVPVRASETRGKTLDSLQTLRMGRFNERPERHEPDYPMVSQATNIARGGLQGGGIQKLKGTYLRDPQGGAWFL